MDEISRKAAKIKLAVFDIDGVLTDGGIFLNDNGEELKRFHVHDGQGLVLLKQSGCHVAVITARSAEIVSSRMKELGIEHVYQNQSDKSAALAELMTGLNIKNDAVAYTGDDLVDLAAMNMAGLAIAVADAHPVALKQADWVTTRRGGNGAVREICELLLQAQGKYDEILEQFLGGNHAT